jgi:hypothetical protein
LWPRRQRGGRNPTPFGGAGPSSGALKGLSLLMG